jgi:nitroreductase
VDVADALRRRRMTRAFDGSPVDEAHLVSLCAEAMRAPTAGHARGVDAVVLHGADGVATYLSAATDERWRTTAPRAAGLAAAGAAVVVVCDPRAYAARYAEADKEASGLGDPAAWPVPYWHGDAAFFTMALLLLAEDAGLAACFLGAFRRHDEVLSAIRAPEGSALFGAVLLGGSSPVQVPSASTSRPGRTRAERVHRGGFSA